MTGGVVMLIAGMVMGAAACAEESASLKDPKMIASLPGEAVCALPRGRWLRRCQPGPAQSRPCWRLPVDCRWPREERHPHAGLARRANRR